MRRRSWRQLDVKLGSTVLNVLRQFLVAFGRAAQTARREPAVVVPGWHCMCLLEFSFELRAQHVRMRCCTLPRIGDRDPVGSWVGSIHQQRSLCERIVCSTTRNSRCALRTSAPSYDIGGRTGRRRVHGVPCRRPTIAQPSSPASNKTAASVTQEWDGPQYCAWWVVMRGVRRVGCEPASLSIKSTPVAFR